jgi:hypothetical protein
LFTNICLEIAQQTRHLSRGLGGQLLAVGDTAGRDQRFANEIEVPSDVVVPQTPASPIDDFNEIRIRLAIVRGGVRSASLCSGSVAITRIVRERVTRQRRAWPEIIRSAAVLFTGR